MCRILRWVLPLLLLVLAPGASALLDGSDDGLSDPTGVLDDDPLMEGDAADVDGSVRDAVPTDEAPIDEPLGEATDATIPVTDADTPLDSVVDPVAGTVPDLHVDVGAGSTRVAVDTGAMQGSPAPAAERDTASNTHTAAAATVVVAAQAGGAAWLPLWQSMQPRIPGAQGLSARLGAAHDAAMRIPGRLRGHGDLLLVLLAQTPLAGLFSRIEDELDGSPVRAAILAHLQARPGSSIRAIQRAQGVAWGTAVYHLNRLEKAGHVVSHRTGRARRYWDAGSAEAAQRRRAIVLKSETPRRLAVAVTAEPGLAQKELCGRLGMSPSVASKHLSRLAVAGLIEVQARSRSRIYYPTPALQRVAQIMGDWPPGPDSQEGPPGARRPKRPLAAPLRDAKPKCDHVHAPLCTHASSPSASASA